MDLIDTSILGKHQFEFQFPIQLPANIPGKAVEGDPSTWVPTTCVGDLHEVLDSGFSCYRYLGNESIEGKSLPVSPFFFIVLSNKELNKSL